MELWLVQLWLAHPEGEGPVEQWDPLRRLRALAGGTGGYLAPLLSLLLAASRLLVLQAGVDCAHSTSVQVPATAK